MKNLKDLGRATKSMFALFCYVCSEFDVGIDDVLIGADADNLYSEKEYDYLLGGTGFDTYYVSHQDVINDADGLGLIMFNDKPLSGTKTKIDEYSYEDDNFTYTLYSPIVI